MCLAKQINNMDIKQFNSLVLKQYVPKHVKAYHIEKTSEMLIGGVFPLLMIGIWNHAVNHTV